MGSMSYLDPNKNKAVEKAAKKLAKEGVAKPESSSSFENIYEKEIYEDIRKKREKRYAEEMKRKKED